ncbi:MarR family winged helix-turn-helix transcriptional regulator [Actinoplanes couchii]|uniref:MarR family transcriptional regulator n=1 Tax=Actinoplanes couchii TaxID=403638 RepID=A0ABQ3XMW3_9ACTN|nr:MarR family transcriptional regulator [Actinoplanes couchii]MDR6317849.1 DNA-binding MarR family transcriptional regulator [Actinoplanes couchii]GID59836.1 MarR family transcriptional regulator [Actinoplanes couchii]
MSDSTSVPWLSAAEEPAWRALISVLTTLPPAIDAQLKRDSGINFFEYAILSSLSEAPGRAVRMGQLAHLAAGSPSRLSHAVARLEKHGWVERRSVETATEARCVWAALTDAGWDAIVDAAPPHVREARRLVFDVLTPEQVDQLTVIGRQLLMAAAPHMRSCLGPQSGS